MKSSISCPGCNSKVLKRSMFCLECGINLLIASKPKIPEIGSYDIRKTDTLLAEYDNLKKTLATVSDAESLEELQNQHYKALESDYLDLYKQADQLKAQVNSEKLDVEALNKLTWGTLKARITSKKAELLSKEENEYFTAVAMYESTLKERDEQKK